MGDRYNPNPILASQWGETVDPLFSYSEDEHNEEGHKAFGSLRASFCIPEAGEDCLEYQKVVIDSTPKRSPEVVEVCHFLEYASRLRKKYLFVPRNPYQSFDVSTTLPNEEIPIPPTSDHIIKEIDGVWTVFMNEEAEKQNQPLAKPMRFSAFAKDLYQLMRIISHGPCKTFSYQRLQLLEAKFSLHRSLNSQAEALSQKKAAHRDFYNVRKVDGHVHHSSSMNQKHLLKFIKHKVRDCGDEEVIHRDGKTLTLQQVFDSLGMTYYDLSVDTLDVHAHNDTFHRFDKFNLKYNPCGQSRLREIFLKTDNLIKGRYLAELTKELCDELEASKYQMAEWRISIYGRSALEWDKLSSWVVDNELYSHNVRWLIQIPRLYSVYKQSGTPGLDCFLSLLKNIFEPLFKITVSPESNPKFHNFLKQVVGFDTVDDESTRERNIAKGIPSPATWNSDKNPPYNYYLYYIYANVYSLNKLREARGFNTFSFRPHCGEAGNADHSAGAFLLANSINHGITLRKTPVLQYLFYLEQIGLAMSPLSNNALFLSYSKNPFPEFFAKGLNVALSTDDPLQFHYSKEALIEEYSVAKAVWKFTSADLSEMARNSALQSGFSHASKKAWLGENYFMDGVTGNDIRKTNVPDIRVGFREDNLKEEWDFILSSIPITQDIGRSSTPTLSGLSRW